MEAPYEVTEIIEYIAENFDSHNEKNMQMALICSRYLTFQFPK